MNKKQFIKELESHYGMISSQAEKMINSIISIGGKEKLKEAEIILKNYGISGLNKWFYNLESDNRRI